MPDLAPEHVQLVLFIVSNTGIRSRGDKKSYLCDKWNFFCQLLCVKAGLLRGPSLFAIEKRTAVA